MWPTLTLKQVAQWCLVELILEQLHQFKTVTTKQAELPGE